MVDFEDFNPAVERVIDYIERYRKATGRKSKLLEMEIIPDDQMPGMYRMGEFDEPVYNLTPEQIEWLYPAAKSVPFNYDKDYMNDFSGLDEAVLNRLVEEKTPEPEYFEKGELDVIYDAGDNMSSPPIDFIRISLSSAIKLC